MSMTLGTSAGVAMTSERIGEPQATMAQSERVMKLACHPQIETQTQTQAFRFVGTWVVTRGQAPSGKD
jgi:hypothetical protein